MNRHKLLIGLALTVWFGVIAGRLVDARQTGAQQPPAQQPPAQTPPKPTPPTQTPPTPAPSGQLPAGYAGTDTCVLCHDAESKTMTQSRHGQTKDPRSPAATLGCESCHGPGQKHVDDDAKGNIKRFKQLKPAEVNETCLSCHNRGTHAGWDGSAHAARNLTCTTCHSVHTPEIDGEPTGEADRDAALRHLPSSAGGEDRAGSGAHARPRRQDGVLVVP